MSLLHDSFHAFRHFPVALAVTDRDGRIELANARFHERFGSDARTSMVLDRTARGATPEWHRVAVPELGFADHATSAYVIAAHGQVLIAFDDAPAILDGERVEQLRQHVDSLRQLASTDHLTGAWNRAHFDRVVAHEMARCVETHTPTSLVVLDIDHFERVNDRHGHPAGDAVLQDLARTVRGKLRASDLLFRWQGDEFVVLLAAAGRREAARVADHLRTSIAAHRFPHGIAVTVSAGVAEHVEGESPLEWFARADRALHEAKAAGRDRTVAARGGSSDAWADHDRRALLHIDWSEAYECGDELIDADHRLLFDLANALLQAALRPGACPRTLNDHFARLRAATADHFASEEQVLQRVGYAHLPEHRRVHAGLLRRADGLESDMHAGRAPVGALVEFVVRDVVVGHLLHVDRAFFEAIAREAAQEATVAARAVHG